MERVRFAPSPTGDMHIGNLRTAIYNWIFCQQVNGYFFIRIEDTDESRSTLEYQDQIFKILDKMHINYNKYTDNIVGCKNGIVTQSLRISVYQKYADELFQKGYAFYCQCVEDCENCNCKTLDLTEGVLRFKVPENIELSFDDLVFGSLNINTNNIENFALLRSNKTPTYMLAVVIDDIEMGITTVIRGEDHKTNTFKQILLYKALGKQHPKFAHLPMIIGQDGRKLSKRNGNTSVKHYLDQGFVPDAIFNILLKLGWGSGNIELISKKEIIDIFKFSDIKKSPAKFDEQKLKNFSGKYLKSGNYVTEVENFITEKYGFSSSMIKNLYDEVIKRSDTFIEFYEQIEFLWKNPNIEPKIPIDILEFLKDINVWQKDVIFEKLKIFCIQEEIDIKDIVKKIRLKITNKEFSPDIFLILEVIGKEKSINLLEIS